MNPFPWNRFRAHVPGFSTGGPFNVRLKPKEIKMKIIYIPSLILSAFLSSCGQNNDKITTQKEITANTENKIIESMLIGKYIDNYDYNLEIRNDRIITIQSKDAMFTENWSLRDNILTRTLTSAAYKFGKEWSFDTHFHGYTKDYKIKQLSKNKLILIELKSNTEITYKKI